ncbi:hypothetical protein MSC49_40850 (plasmid) [Methylosinus sp. C49]|nr:hypothetical protein MSC49_40850 [Methylosinus sp. C49]
MEHTVRIIPAQFVKPFVKSNKNDARDAEAIAEAVTRPTMRFVEIKSPAQVDLQALHRIRDRIVANRTQLICQMRAFCLEYGVAIRQGAGVFKADIGRVIGDETNDLTPTMRELLTELWEEFKAVDLRMATVSRQIETAAGRMDAARRLMTIPGIGPLEATALMAAVGDGRQFKTALEQARDDIARRRRRWRSWQERLDPQRLVFIDETWITTNMTPLRGWGAKACAYAVSFPTVTGAR